MLPPTPVISGFSVRLEAEPQEEKSLMEVAVMNSMGPPSLTKRVLAPCSACSFRKSPSDWVMDTQGMLDEPVLICMLITPVVLLYTTQATAPFSWARACLSGKDTPPPRDTTTILPATSTSA